MQCLVQNIMPPKPGGGHENAQPIFTVSGIWPFRPENQNYDFDKHTPKDKILSWSTYMSEFGHPAIDELDLVPNFRNRDYMIGVILFLLTVLFLIMVGCCITLLRARTSNQHISAQLLKQKEGTRASVDNRNHEKSTNW